MRNTSARLESEIRRVTDIAEDMGISLTLVSGMLVLQGQGAMVITPAPRDRADWYSFGDWQLYELLYSRSYRRRSADYGEQKPSVTKSLTRKEIYAEWDRVAKHPLREAQSLAAQRLLERLHRVHRS
jgi:hypothetical protein